MAWTRLFETARMRIISVTKLLRSVFLLLKGMHRDVIWQALTMRLYSDTTYLGLRRDLSTVFKAPDAKIPLKVRPFDPRDDLSFIDINRPGISSTTAFDCLHQINMLKAGIQICYLALDHNDQPCYMQWLIPSSENDKIQALFGKIFPHLEKDEALLEAAYTVEDRRGQGIMASAMAQIAERANELGVRQVITFVGEQHVASLKGCKKAGFVPYVRRREIYRLFRHKVTFTPLPEGTPYPFDLEYKHPQALTAAGAE